MERNIHDTPLKHGVCGMKNRTVNALLRCGCRTIGDVIEMLNTEPERFYGSYGVGNVIIEDVMDTLDVYCKGWRGDNK